MLSGIGVFCYGNREKGVLMDILAVFLSVSLMGFTCSAGCSSATTPFILGSLLGEGKDIKESRKAIIFFSLGKIIAYSLFGLLSAIFGSVVLSFIEESYPNITIWIVRVFTALFGVWLIYQALNGLLSKKEAQSSCSSCPSKCNSKKLPKFAEYKQFWVYIAVGALYAAIPCAPLVTSLTFASTMTPVLGMLLLTVFSVVNSILPVIIYATLVGMANKEFTKKTPKMLNYIKIVGGIVLLYITVAKV